MPAALDDVTVVSFAQLGQGPIATQMLGDMGAEVIKIERPETGEWMRQWSMANAYKEGESVVWLSVNRNKKSVEADLKNDEHREAVLDLLDDNVGLVE
jgi:crotonobetainyl-CoA:carnitine CoA-transferase CaiB-like acyl-CoA transferase